MKHLLQRILGWLVEQARIGADQDVRMFPRDRTGRKW